MRQHVRYEKVILAIYEYNVIKVESWFKGKGGLKLLFTPMLK